MSLACVLASVCNVIHLIIFSIRAYESNMFILHVLYQSLWVSPVYSHLYAMLYISQFFLLEPMSQTCLYFMLCIKACACCVSTYYFLIFRIKVDEWHLCILLHTLCSARKPVNVASRLSIACSMFCIKAYTINICLVGIVCRPMNVASLCFHLLYSQQSSETTFSWPGNGVWFLYSNAFQESGQNIATH